MNNLRNRVGQFSISKQMILACPETVMKIMGKVIVMRAEYMFTDNIEYIAISPEFKELPEGTSPTHYIPMEIKGNDGSSTLFFREM